MALSDEGGDPLALGNGGPHPLSAGGNAASNPNTSVTNCQDPLTAASSGDCLAVDGDKEKAASSKVQQKKPRSHVVQTAKRPSQNGGVVKQNGSLRNIPPSSTASSTGSQTLAKRHLTSTSPSLQPPPLCCQHCNFQSTVRCQCGQQDCPLFQNQGPGPGPGLVPHPGGPPSCPCCLPAGTYTQTHPHPSSPACLHHHHHQPWQEHLQSPTHGAGIRYVVGQSSSSDTQASRHRPLHTRADYLSTRGNKM